MLVSPVLAVIFGGSLLFIFSAGSWLGFWCWCSGRVLSVGSFGVTALVLGVGEGS